MSVKSSGDVAVSEAMKTKDISLERYSRMLALRDFSRDDLERIRRTAVTVVGAGGLGSPVLRLLTAIGFGTIRVIDHDIVDLSNLQRQTIYTTEDIGRPKVEAAVERLAAVNPDVRLDPVLDSITPRNAEELLHGSDMVLDGLDTIHARRIVNIATQRLGIPYVYAGAIEYYGNASTFIPGETGCLHCLLGDARDDPERTCAVVGVTPTILEMVGAIEVQEAVLLATGRRPNLAGRLLHADIRSLSLESFEIGRAENCPVCSAPGEVEPEMSDDITVTMLCTNSFNITPPEDLSLDLEEIASRMEEKTYRVKRSRLFVAVDMQDGVTVTVMRRGTAVVKGVTDPDLALRLYKQVVGID